MDPDEVVQKLKILLARIEGFNPRRYSLDDVEDLVGDLGDARDVAQELEQEIAHGGGYAPGYRA